MLNDDDATRSKDPFLIVWHWSEHAKSSVGKFVGWNGSPYWCALIEEGHVDRCCAHAVDSRRRLLVLFRLVTRRDPKGLQSGEINWTLGHFETVQRFLELGSLLLVQAVDV